MFAPGVCHTRQPPSRQGEINQSYTECNLPPLYPTQRTRIFVVTPNMDVMGSVPPVNASGGRDETLGVLSLGSLIRMVTGDIKNKGELTEF